MLKLPRRGLAAFAAIAGLAAAAPVAAEPGMWVIRDHDSTIYLFGTVHALKPDVKWRSAGLDKALAAVGELVLEVSGMDDPASMLPLFRAHGMDPANPLSRKLKPADWARLTAAAKDMGLPPQALEPMRPWLAALMISVAPLVKAGYDPKSGVELVLTGDAKSAGKPILALESAEQQIKFFADLSPKAELEYLVATLDTYDQAAVKLNAMVTAWESGDTSKLETQFLEESGFTDDLYETIVVRRNRAWADQLKAKLAGSGVSFVAVGAGHLVGPDSVQQELRKRGVKVERR
jgi:uncharacterized protein